jgi:hypothetical protein
LRLVDGQDREGIPPLVAQNPDRRRQIGVHPSRSSCPDTISVRLESIIGNIDTSRPSS